MTTKYRVITTSGLTSSGTTTITELLAAELGWKIENPTSQFVRNYLAQHNLPLSALGVIPDADERKNDETLQSLIASGNHLLVTSRLAGVWAQKVPGVYKIFVACDVQTRISRFAKREELAQATAEAEVTKREAAELAKYQRLYGIDARDPKWYDLIIDTTAQDPHACLTEILEKIS